MNNPSQGYYCLIQYCPDLGRLEAANVGVLLFCPERRFLKALTSHQNRRIIRFFGSQGHDWSRIKEFKEGLEHRLALESDHIHTLEQLNLFIAQRANLLQITAPRPMKVTDPEQDLAELFKELMQEIHRPSSRSLRNYVGQRFASAGLERKIVHDIKVTVPILERQIEVPYGFQNGRFNLINPARFEAAKIEQIEATACKYAVEGKSLYETRDPKFGTMKLLIVGKFRRGDHESPGRVKRILDRHNVELFKTSELPRLINEIRLTGRHISPSAS